MKRFVAPALALGVLTAPAGTPLTVSCSDGIRTTRVAAVAN